MEKEQSDQMKKRFKKSPTQLMDEGRPLLHSRQRAGFRKIKNEMSSYFEHSFFNFLQKYLVFPSV